MHNALANFKMEVNESFVQKAENLKPTPQRT